MNTRAMLLILAMLTWPLAASGQAVNNDFSTNTTGGYAAYYWPYSTSLGASASVYHDAANERAILRAVGGFGWAAATMKNVPAVPAGADFSFACRVEVLSEYNACLYLGDLRGVGAKDSTCVLLRLYTYGQTPTIRLVVLQNGAQTELAAVTYAAKSADLKVERTGNRYTFSFNGSQLAERAIPELDGMDLFCGVANAISSGPSGWTADMAFDNWSFAVKGAAQAPPAIVADAGGPATLDADQLDQLLAPVALYPDSILAQLLPACSYPADVQAANDYLQAHPQAGDSEIDQQSWEPSVKALARYPEVLKTLTDHPDWTAALGAAFVAQGQDVMESIQRLRQKAADAQNLQSTPEQQVVAEDGDIEILPTDPQVLYIPVYDPILVYERCPQPYIWVFGPRRRIGLWLDNSCDWYRHWVGVGIGWHFGWRNDGHRWLRDGSVTTVRINDVRVLHAQPTRPWKHNVAKPVPVMPPVLAHPMRDENRGWSGDHKPTPTPPRAMRPFELPIRDARPAQQGAVAPRTPARASPKLPPAPPTAFDDARTRDQVQQTRERFQHDRPVGQPQPGGAGPLPPAARNPSPLPAPSRIPQAPKFPPTPIRTTQMPAPNPGPAPEPAPRPAPSRLPSARTPAPSPAPAPPAAPPPTVHQPSVARAAPAAPPPAPAAAPAFNPGSGSSTDAQSSRGHSSMRR